MEEDGERGRKRRRTMEGSKKKRRKVFWEDDAGWRDATPVDPMALLVGSEEGGFYSLEEIDGEVFDGTAALDPVTVSEERVHKVKKKKRRQDVETADTNLPAGVVDELPEAGQAKRRKVKKKGKKAREDIVVPVEGKTSGEVEGDNLVVDNLIKTESVALARKIAKQQKPPAPEEEAGNSIVVAASGADVDDGPKQVSSAGQLKSKYSRVLKPSPEIADFDLSAWVHLRLHPLLGKAIASLGFKEPTPIQNACIPAAAHQGKDVIGAAETGSGKTLAFGIPILQRILEEQEKDRRQTGDEPEGEQIASTSSGPLRALIITPTRELALQVSDHLKSIAKYTNVRVVAIVGGMATQKQQRLLKQKPDIVVATPGRLWELMSEGEKHLLDLHALSFFVLDEADRMVERGHFQELQSIIDMLPKVDKYGRSQHQDGPSEAEDKVDPGGNPVEEVEPDDSVRKQGISKRRQTLVFSATLALPDNFKKKLKRGLQARGNVESSIAALSERAGVRHTAAIVDLTSKSIVAQQLVESVIECRDDEKDAYLYYILKVHGCGQTIVFCTSIAAVRRVSSILRLLQLPVWPLHAQMQQRQRLKAMDRFREAGHSILVATDVAARGLDIPGIRTVIHYQLPHSAEVYVHRSGRTARAQTDGCSITFVTPTDRSKYAALCGSLSKKDGLSGFPVDSAYMPAVERRVTLAVQVDKLSRNVSQDQGQRSWLALNAEALGLDLEDSDKHGGDEDNHKGRASAELKKLQQQLGDMLRQPLEPKSFSRRYITGVGISPLVAKQLREVVGVTRESARTEVGKKPKGSFVVIGQEAIEPLEAVRKSMLESQHKRNRSSVQPFVKGKPRGRGRRR